MLIAVATDDGVHLSQHFGRCMFFSIWQHKGGQPPVDLGVRVNTFTMHAQNNPADAGREIKMAPHAGEVPDEPAQESHEDELPGRGEHQHGNKPGHGMHSHARVLSGLADVKVVIAAGMGRRAVNDLQENDKEIYITQESEVASAVRMYTEGTLDSGEACHDH